MTTNCASAILPMIVVDDGGCDEDVFLGDCSPIFVAEYDCKIGLYLDGQ